MNETYNTYVEILPFDKMINDSKSEIEFYLKNLVYKIVYIKSAADLTSPV